MRASPTATAVTDMSAFKPRATLVEQVARHLENRIVFGQLRSGERIYEAAMAKEMDVSHGSIREGLLLLEKRHLVRNIPRKGAVVTPLDAHFVRSHPCGTRQLATAAHPISIAFLRRCRS